MSEQRKIRILIADDSYFMRKLLKELIESHNQFEVVATAKDGVEAMGEAVRTTPDVITMDYNMPKMNGAQTAKEILIKLTKPPAIIMISAYTAEGTQATFESLNAGAVDFIQKPSGELSFDIKKIENEIVTKILVAAGAHVTPAVKYREPQRKVEHKKLFLKPKIVIIGSSTGGPPVVETILTLLPEKIGFPIFIAQHMPKIFTTGFASRLNNVTKLNVLEAGEKEEIKAGNCYIAPGDINTELQKSDSPTVYTHTFQEKVEKYLYPSIDKLMISSANVYSGSVLGIILTGMGSDGTKGAQAIKDAGGFVIAQDPNSAVVNSMPSSVIDAHLADQVLNPSVIASKLIDLSS